MSDKAYLQSGEMGRHLDGFAKFLSEQGYRPHGIKYRLRIGGAFGRCL